MTSCIFAWLPALPKKHTRYRYSNQNSRPVQSHGWSIGISHIGIVHCWHHAQHTNIHIHVHYCWHSWQRGSWNTLECFTSTGRWRNGEETISAIRSQGASIEGKPCDSGNVVETSTYWLDLPKCCDYFSDSTMLNHINCCFHVARTCCLHLLPLYFKQFGEDGEILAKPMSMEEMSSWVCPATCDGWLQFLCVLLYCFMALLMHW